jgi:hypothetical protein
MTTETTKVYEPTIALANSKVWDAEVTSTRTVAGKPVVTKRSIKTNIGLLDNGPIVGIADLHAFLMEGLCWSEVACKTHWDLSLRYSPSWFLPEYEKPNVGTNGVEYPERPGMGVGVRFHYEEGRTIFVSARILLGIVYGQHVAVGRNVPQLGKKLTAYDHVPFNAEMGMPDDVDPTVAFAVNYVVKAKTLIEDFVGNGSTKIACATLTPSEVADYVEAGWEMSKVYTDPMAAAREPGDLMLQHAGVAYGRPALKRDGTPILDRRGRSVPEFVGFISIGALCLEATGIKPDEVTAKPRDESTKSDNVTFGAVAATVPARVK